jgi:hypothetical protein
MDNTYQSLIEQGRIIAQNISGEYSPINSLPYERLSNWRISIAEQFPNMSFEEQKSLVGLSKIVSDIMEDDKAMYYTKRKYELFDLSDLKKE